MVEQWSKVGAVFLVATIILFAFGLFSVIIVFVGIVGSFAAAYGLLRSAYSDLSQAEPPKPGATQEEINAARDEIHESVDLGYRTAEAALEKTLIEWESLVDAKLGINIFDSVNDIDKWPLDDWAVRRHTGLAVEEYLQNRAYPPETTQGMAERAGRLDEKNYRLRAAVGAHFAKSGTSRRGKA